MEFSIVGALIAGLVGTLVMSMMMKMAGAAGMTDMPPMELVTGAMVSGDEQQAKRIGFVVHWLMMGTVLFGLAYAAVFSLLDSAAWVLGLGVGVAHGAAVGLVFMPMMPAMHPRMSPTAVGASSVTVEGGEVHLSSPGIFGKEWGAMTPVGLLMGHAVYGVVVALVYGAFV